MRPDPDGVDAGREISYVVGWCRGRCRGVGVAFVFFLHAGRCGLGFTRSAALLAGIRACRGRGLFGVAGPADVTACEW